MKINEKNFIQQLKNKDECINDILLAVWYNIDKFDEKRSTFKNWLAGISKYKAIDIQRKYLNTLDRENIDDLNITVEDTIEREVIENVLDENVNELLGCLKKEDRELFIKVYVEEKEIDEIAVDIGVKIDVIYNRLSRGKKKIKNIFKTV